MRHPPANPIIVLSQLLAANQAKLVPDVSHFGTGMYAPPCECKGSHILPAMHVQLRNAAVHMCTHRGGWQCIQQVKLVQAAEVTHRLAPERLLGPFGCQRLGAVG
jgi:hypothetical protein